MHKKQKGLEVFKDFLHAGRIALSPWTAGEDENDSTRFQLLT